MALLLPDSVVCLSCTDPSFYYLSPYDKTFVDKPPSGRYIIVVHTHHDSNKPALNVPVRISYSLTNSHKATWVFRPFLCTFEISRAIKLYGILSYYPHEPNAQPATQDFPDRYLLKKALKFFINGAQADGIGLVRLITTL